MSFLFAPGFWSSGPVHRALLAGAVVAVASGVVGVFTVVRGQSFAGHAFCDLGTLGGSGAFLTGASPLAGYVVVGTVVAGVMELVGVQRRRGRDVATGIVLGAALGVSALFLYLETTSKSTAGATVTILFGSLFTVAPSEVPAMAALAALVVAAVAWLHRPLLVSLIHADLAAIRGVPVRALGAAFLVVMGVAVALSAVTVGTVLSTALLIGPAAAALRLTRRPSLAMALASGLAAASVWLGVLLSYDSYGWPPADHGWPVSFFVVAIVFVIYLATGLAGRRSRRDTTAATLAAIPEPD